MYYRQSLSSFFLSFIIFFLVPFSVSSRLSASKFSDCAPTPFCKGYRANISYPFRIPDMPSYCGHPGFEVACINNNSMLAISITGKQYHVQGIDYHDQVLDVTNPDFSSESCPNMFTNTTLDLSLLNFTEFDRNLTVYLNCSHVISPPNLHNISCLVNNITGKHSYYGLEEDNVQVQEMLQNCSSVVLIPIYQDIARPLANGRMDFMGAVQEGFGLRWTVGSGWCKGCSDSGGICGYNPESPDASVCFCPDSTTALGTCGSAKDIIKPETGGNEGKRFIIGSVVGAGFLLVFLSLALYFHKRRKVSSSIIFCKRNLNSNQKNIEAFLEEYGSLAPKRYWYSDVKKITKAFQEKLGQGGYGTVFKGTLSNGIVVAVKILNDSEGDGEEFINEVVSIGRTSHVNVVNLLGFCSEGSKRALIYEFMCNGSLEKLIYSEKPKTTFDWEKLYQIALGIARGLEYLHRGCNTRIVHFDIKPHNILLDQDFCPKISDFGLAKLCLKNESLISIAGARGTIGYIAPEVFSRNFGIVSSKSDVYSYGMMLLEIVGGRKNASVGGENSSETYFPHWIYEHLDQNGDLLAYGVAAESEETVRKMILAGLWCIQTMPQNRPSMSRVIEMLEGNVNDLQVPPKPYLSSSPLGSLIGTSSIQDICLDDSSSLVHS